MSRLRVVVAASALFALLVCLPEASDAQEPRLMRNPDPRVQAYLAQHADEISRLRSVAEDQTNRTETRRDALQKLSIISEDEVLPTAAKLIADPAPQLRSAAVELLTSSIVMAGHGNQGSPADHHVLPPG